MLKNGKKWSRKYNKCIICGTTEKEHKAKGLCKKCYERIEYKRNFRKHSERSEKYNKNNKKKISEYNEEYYKENVEKCKKNKKKWYIKNSEKVKKKTKEWAIKNPDMVKISQKKYRRCNPEKVKEWINNNREKYNKNHREYQKNKLLNDPFYKLKRNVSKAISAGLKKRLLSKNGKSTFTFLPYTVDELKEHLEKQFEPWMNWNNWGSGKGKWNIDHRIPHSFFNYKSVNDKEFQKCWALKNLRPLDAIENIKKKDKIINKDN